MASTSPNASLGEKAPKQEAKGILQAVHSGLDAHLPVHSRPSLPRHQESRSARNQVCVWGGNLWPRRGPEVRRSYSQRGEVRENQENLLNFCGFSRTRAGDIDEETPALRLEASCLQPHPQGQLGLGT